jgi:soluble lytic murein transglycosylase-like protein
MATTSRSAVAALAVAIGAVALVAPAAARSDVPLAAVGRLAARASLDLPGVAARVHAQVAARMRSLDAAMHRRVARTILAEAKRAGLDPFLVVALIIVESSFDPHAVSSAGAVGLMQLRAGTMRSEVERSRLPSADPRDPVASVQAGVRYLRRLIAAFGEVDHALMAYNAGPARILGHLRQGAIPERFHVYPRRVNEELERMRQARAAPAPALLAAAG